MDIVWTLGLIVLWVALIALVFGLVKLESHKGDRS